MKVDFFKLAARDATVYREGVVKKPAEVVGYIGPDVPWGLDETPFDVAPEFVHPDPPTFQSFDPAAQGYRLKGEKR